jgi:hypothetical protein
MVKIKHGHFNHQYSPYNSNKTIHFVLQMKFGMIIKYPYNKYILEKTVFPHPEQSEK